MAAIIGAVALNRGVVSPGQRRLYGDRLHRDALQGDAILIEDQPVIDDSGNSLMRAG